MVDAISTKYGPATLPATAVVPSLSGVFINSDRILAHWGDSQYSVDLTSYLSTFALVVSSKRLDALARVAAVESIRLDKQEAPQREIERQQRSRLRTIASSKRRPGGSTKRFFDPDGYAVLPFLKSLKFGCKLALCGLVHAARPPGR